MRAPVEAVATDPAELHECEEVCRSCRLVHWRGGLPEACDRREVTP